MSLRRRKFFKVVAIVAGGFVILLAGLLIAFRVTLARAPAYRAQVQAWVSERTKLDIEFARLDARWRFYGPELVFDQAIVRSADRKINYVSARRVSLGYDIWTAITTFRLAAGRLTIEAPELQVIRTTEGRFEILGQSDLPERDPSHRFEPDAIPTGELQVVNARVSFRDLKSGRGPWIIPGVSFQLHRTGRQMALQGAAELPTTLGKALHFDAQTNGKLAVANDLVWSFAVDAQDLNLAGWAEISPPNSLAPSRGRGSFKLSGELQGARIDALTAHVRFDAVTLTLPTWTTPLPAEAQLLVPPEDQVEATNDDVNVTASSVETDAKSEVAPARDAENAVEQSTIESSAAESKRVEAEVRDHVDYKTIAFDLNVIRHQSVDNQTWDINLEHVQLSRAEQPWRDTTVTATFTQSNEDAFTVVASTDVIVLENIWPLLAYAPESKAMAQLRATAVGGRLQQLQLSYVKDEVAATQYSVSAHFQQLSARAIGKTPGIEHFSGTVQATEHDGQLELNVRDGALLMPRFFRTSLPADRITGLLKWQHASDGWRITTDNLVMQNADGHAQATANILLPADGGSPLADVKAVGSNLMARSAPRYMPAGTLSRHSLSWLDRAFPMGEVANATLELRGPMHAFPFRNNEGLFLIKAHIEGLSLDYQPGWMPATELVVDAEFRNQGMSAKATSGVVNGMHLKAASGRIVDFKNPVLLLNADIEGNLSLAVPFVKESPIGPALGNLFMALEAAGDMRSVVKLRMPLKHLEQRQLTIDTHINAATVGLQGLQQQATQVAGNLVIEDHAVKTIAMQGEFLQGPLSVTGGNEDSYTGAGAGLQLQAQGRAAGVQLAELLHLPSSVSLGGSMQWQLTGRIPRRAADESARPAATVTSDSKGLSVGLPEPIGKTAEQTRALRFDIETPADDTLLVRLAFGKARALARLEHQDDQWQLDRAGLRADGQAAALPAHTGLRIEGDIERFVLDDWLKIKSDRAGGRPISDYLRAANVNVGEFGLYGYSWKNVRGILQAMNAAWRVDVASDDITGQLQIPFSFDSGKPLELNLSKLDIGERSGGGPATHTDPRDLPALRGRVDELQLSGRDVGMLRFDLQKDARGVKLASLELRGPSFTANAHGDWLVSDTSAEPAASSELIFDVASTDARETLRAFNYHDVLTAKRANVYATLRWPGGPDEQMLGRASGTLMIEMADGQLLGIQPGTKGRVLGLMSLSALPRRLSLDFSDLTEKGLGFDTIHGDFELKDGNAYTRNLLLRGPAAEVGVVGRTGLGTHDYDQTAIVTGNLGGSLGVAGTVVGGPVIGAALLLFSQIFKEPLQGATRGYYRITGPWESPQVEQIKKDQASQPGADDALTTPAPIQAPPSKD